MTDTSVLALARSLGVTTRTVWNWAYARGGESRRLGRPPHGDLARKRALRAVAAQMLNQGHDVGWRCVRTALRNEVPKRLVQASLKVLKRAHRKSRRKYLARRRAHLDVLAVGALVSLDATHLATQDDGTKVLGEIARDVASTKTIEATAGPPATADDTIALLERMNARGELPLVCATDNGSQYCNDAVERYFASHAVIHLVNLPRVPQHNPWVERGNRDYKTQMLVRKVDVASVQHELDQARRTLDEGRLRPSRNYLTAAQCAQTMPAASTIVMRSAFYAAARRAITEAEARHDRTRARHLAVREAILATMEEYGLIKRTRGDAPRTPRRHERIT